MKSRYKNSNWQITCRRNPFYFEVIDSKKEQKRILSHIQIKSKRVWRLNSIQESSSNSHFRWMTKDHIHIYIPDVSNPLTWNNPELRLKINLSDLFHLQTFTELVRWKLASTHKTKENKDKYIKFPGETPRSIRLYSDKFWMKRVQKVKY